VFSRSLYYPSQLGNPVSICRRKTAELLYAVKEITTLSRTLGHSLLVSVVMYRVSSSLDALSLVGRFSSLLQRRQYLLCALCHFFQLTISSVAGLGHQTNEYRCPWSASCFLSSHSITLRNRKSCIAYRRRNSPPGTESSRPPHVWAVIRLVCSQNDVDSG